MILAVTFHPKCVVHIFPSIPEIKKANKITFMFKQIIAYFT